MISQATAEDAQRAREEAQAAQEREAESARSADQAREEAQQAKALAASSATAAELARQSKGACRIGLFVDPDDEQLDGVTKQVELQLRNSSRGQHLGTMENRTEDTVVQ